MVDVTSRELLIIEIGLIHTAVAVITDVIGKKDLFGIGTAIS